MSPKFNALRSVIVAVVSTLLVVGLGLVVTMTGSGLPGVSDLVDEQRVSGAASPPPGEQPVLATEDAAAQDGTEPTEAETPTPEEKALQALVADVEKAAATKPRVVRTRVAVSARASTNEEPSPPAPTPYSFQLASFNILGSQHTAPGGDARGYAPGRTRAEWAARIILDRGVDIVGWSEIQADQYAAMMRATRGTFEGWPGTALGNKGIPASLMWRTSQFEAVWKGSVTIPFVGQQRPMPVVQLRERATGREFFVMNVHNAPQDREGERNIAEDRELSLIRTLRQESGLPVFLTGDFNEKEEIFCRVTGTTDLVAAAGGSNSGGCNPPRGMRVDWIFGSRDATFSGYVADQGASIRRVTDHAALFTNVTVN